MKNKKIFTITIKKSDYSSRLLFLWLSELFIMTGVRFCLSKMGFDSGLIRNSILFFTASIPLVSFFLHIRQFRVEQYRWSAALYIVIIFAFIFTVIIHPEYQYFITRSGYGIERVLRPECALYACLFFCLVDNPNKIFDVLKKYAILDFVYLIIMEFLPAVIRGYWTDVDYMGRQVHRMYSLSLGYSLLLPTIVFLYIFIRKKNICFLTLSIVGMGIIFVYGSRGALLMIVIFVGLMIISTIIESKNISYKIIKITGVLMLIVIICIFGKAILNLFIQIFQTLGVESRSLEMLVQGEFMDDSGRNVIWGTVINAIREGGILGYGVFGDRPFVYPLHYVGYSHNIFLELIISFGIIGVGISIAIISTSVRMILLCKDRMWRELFIIFFSIACQLILSMSFWYVMEFWAAAAIAHQYFRLSKK